MIDPRFIAEQVARLSSCSFFPAGDRAADYLAEIGQCFARVDSEVVVMAVIEEWVSTQSARPAPADIHKAIQRHKAMVGIPQSTEGICSRCANTGIFVNGPKLIFERCSCAAGDSRAADDWAGRKIDPQDYLATHYGAPRREPRDARS